MSELALTFLRLGFLLLLWLFVMFVISALRRDLAAPDDAPIAGTTTAVPADSGRRRRPKNAARKLIVVEGSLAGTVVPLGSSPVTIGRSQDCTVVLDDDYASSHHTRLSPHDGAWVVEDLGSTNGTWVDRTRVTTPTVLPPGQQLRVGRTVIELRA